MNEAVTVATKAAAEHANDVNWLAVCLLFLAIVALAWLFRWIVGELKSLFKEANEGRIECARIIATNSTVIQECRDTICDATEFMKRKGHSIVIGLILFGLTGCTRFNAVVNALTKAQTKNATEMTEQSRALTTAGVDTLSLAPSNQFTSLALEFARKDQQLEGLPQTRIDVDGLLAGDKTAARDLEQRYQLQRSLIAEKARLSEELDQTRSKLVEMGKLYEAERNKGIVKRVWHWAIGTLGFAGAIAFFVFCPAIAFPIVTQLARGIVSMVPQMSKLFGVVSKGAWDATVNAIEQAKGALDDEGKETLESKLARTMDRAHKNLVKVTKPKLQIQPT
jgi:hypothetical protein